MKFAVLDLGAFFLYVHDHKISRGRRPSPSSAADDFSTSVSVVRSEVSVSFRDETGCASVDSGKRSRLLGSSVSSIADPAELRSVCESPVRCFKFSCSVYVGGAD